MAEIIDFNFLDVISQEELCAEIEDERWQEEQNSMIDGIPVKEYVDDLFNKS